MSEALDYQPLLDHMEAASFIKMMGETPLLSIESAELFKAVTYVKEQMGFSLLLDITAVDNLDFTHPTSTRFELIYLFRHDDFAQTLALKLPVFDPEIGVESIVSLYEVADWLEREVWDQYGVVFQNHPTLKRILNHNEFVGHPLRRDYEITKGQYCTETQDMMDEMKPLLDA